MTDEVWTRQFLCEPVSNHGGTMILKEDFVQSRPAQSVLRQINEFVDKRGIAQEQIISIESHRYDTEEPYPLLVTIWYWVR